MGRSPCCDENNGLKKGPWTTEEDDKLLQYIQKNGHGSWRTLPRLAGLKRCGKSCRLRWTNYLRPDIKRGKFSAEEEQTILHLHSILGNKWSAIATHLPGRTDNEIKNFWNTHLKKRLIQMGFDPMTHRPRTDFFAALPQLIALAALRHDHHQQQLSGLGLGAASDPASAAQHLQQYSSSGVDVAIHAAKLQYLQLQCLLQSVGAGGSSFDPAALCCSPRLTTTTLDSTGTGTPPVSSSATADDGGGGGQLLLPCAFPEAPASSEEEGDEHLQVQVEAHAHQQQQGRQGLCGYVGGGGADADADDVLACHYGRGSTTSLPPLTNIDLDLSDDAAANNLQLPQVHGYNNCSATASSSCGGASIASSSPIPWPEFFPDDPFITDFL